MQIYEVVMYYELAVACSDVVNTHRGRDMDASFCVINATRAPRSIKKTSASTMRVSLPWCNSITRVLSFSVSPSLY